MKKRLRKLPGWIGISLVTLLNALWLYWGLGEAFYEGWGVPETPWFLFLVIGLLAIFFSILAIKFPHIGGGILIVAGFAFAVWWLLPGIKNGFYTLSVALGRLLLSGGFTIVCILFILDGYLNPSKPQADRSWISHHIRLIIAVGIPLLTGLIVAGYNLSIVLTRMDDGDRSARLIIGNDIRLIWAPRGPGWNWKQDFGGYPSWDSLASYGIQPHGLDNDKLQNRHATLQAMKTTGLCAYLDETGQELLPEPQYIWRIPTVDEIARSLSLHNQNAGCEWDGEVGRLTCDIYPDKETPLWAPDEPPVYYWAANPYNDGHAHFVSYSAYVSHQPKDWGNPRHGYRCVKEP